MVTNSAVAVDLKKEKTKNKTGFQMIKTNTSFKTETSSANTFVFLMVFNK